ncbi:MAG: P1 family peptidase [Sciscionella sp.]
MRPGPRNGITDVPGVLVGHHHRLGDGWATGTTVVLVPEGAVAGVEGRGGAPGTRETDLLDPSNLVQRVHGVCLSGGSAYGLAAADGVLRWLAERQHGFRVGAQPHEVVPIVPAAVLFDLKVSEWGNRPDAGFGYAACEAAGCEAAGCEPTCGSVGAGAGATAGSLSGGVGEASAVLDDGTVIGALAVINAYGEAVDMATGRPYGLDAELDGEFGLRVPDTPAELDGAGPASALNTTIGVIAVDAVLDKAECRRLAASAQDGLVRAIRPAHSMFDGDTVFALATGGRTADGDPGVFGRPGRAAVLDRYHAAAAEVFTRAVVHGLLAADGLPGFPSYRQRWPEALPPR